MGARAWLLGRRGCSWQAPAPVIAGALGFHQTTTTRQVAHADGTWNQYPASRP